MTLEEAKAIIANNSGYLSVYTMADENDKWYIVDGTYSPQELGALILVLQDYLDQGK